MSSASSPISADAAELTLWTVTRATEVAETVRGEEKGPHPSPGGPPHPQGGQSERCLEGKTEERWPKRQVETRRTWPPRSPGKTASKGRTRLGGWIRTEGASEFSDTHGEPTGDPQGTGRQGCRSEALARVRVRRRRRSRAAQTPAPALPWEGGEPECGYFSGGDCSRLERLREGGTPRAAGQTRHAGMAEPKRLGHRGGAGRRREAAVRPVCAGRGGTGGGGGRKHGRRAAPGCGGSQGTSPAESGDYR